MIGKAWRDASSLVVLAKQCRETLSRGGVNYEILVQTRPAGASSFASSVVFPGGVTEAVDASPDWVAHIKSFGYTKQDFDAFHLPGTNLVPLFQENPIQRHISLRITAIRETFEELGVLIGSRLRKGQRSGPWADVITDFDVRLWQNKISKNPEELINLCKELQCYPDIWSLHYWSNWLTPAYLPKRFDTAFFVTALENKPVSQGSSEVTHIEWTTPAEILEKKRKKEVILFRPQEYEIRRIAHQPDIEALTSFAAKRSCYTDEFIYPQIFTAKDGKVQLLPGDDLYPFEVDPTIIKVHDRSDLTVLQLREGCATLHRIEITGSKSQFIIKNLKPQNHIAMENIIY